MSKPLLALLSGTVSGFLFLHHQAHLPAYWPVFFASAAIGLALISAVVINRFGSESKWLLPVCWAITFAVAVSLGSNQAHQRIKQQVSADCHKTAIKGMFVLEDVGLRPNQQNKLNFVAATAMPCLSKGARLQSFYPSQDWKVGAKYELQGKIKSPRASLQFKGFDLEQYWMSQGISGTLQLQSEPVYVQKSHSLNLLKSLKQLRLNTSNWLIQTNGTSNQTALLVALISGDQGLLAPEDRQVFTDTGIAHLVAISGLHITLLALAAGRLFSLIWRQNQSLLQYASPQVMGAWFGLIFAVAYGLASGWAVPAQRTVWMLGILYLFRLTGLGLSAWNVWGLALLIVLFLDPWAILDIGCLLSFGAVAILIFAHTSSHCVYKPQFAGIQEAIRGQYAITIGLIPLCWSVFNQQSLISPVANALSIPWMSFVSTPIAILGALTRQDWLVFLADYSLDIQHIWLGWFSELSWATVPVSEPSWWALAFIGLGCVVLLLPQGLLPRWLGLSLIFVVFIPKPLPEYGEVWVNVHDVGQGSAVTIQTRHHVLLFDTGPAFTPSASAGRRVLWPFYQNKGISQLDALWVSHDDNDHSGGAPFLVEQMTIGKLASPFSKDHPLIKQASQKEITTTNCHQTKNWTWDGVLFEPIGLPVDQFNNDNNKSCLLRISTGHNSLLLTGDIQADAEHWLLNHRHDLLESSILFVPHHGSRTSSAREFIAAVNPEIAIVQAGWKNQFKHPHPEVLSRYATEAIGVYSTAQLGALRLQIGPDSRSIKLDCSRFSLRRYWHLHETSAFLQRSCHF